MSKTIIVTGSIKDVQVELHILTEKGYKPVGGIVATGDRCSQRGSSVHHAEMAQTMYNDGKVR